MRAMPEPAYDVICPNCSDANDARDDFCRRCGAPVGRFTTLDPFKAIYAEGWLFRKSATARIRPIVLVGMWALFGAPVAGMLIFAVAQPVRTHAITWLYGLGVCLLYLLVLARVTANFVRNRPGPGPYDPGPPRASARGAAVRTEAAP